MQQDKRFWQSTNLLIVLWIALGLSALVYLATGFLIFREFVNAFEQDNNGLSAAIRTILDKEMAGALVAFLAAPFVAWRTIVAADNTKTAAEEHITNRLNKAEEQLSMARRVPCQLVDKDGKLIIWKEERPTTEARLAGLYSLERIAKDSERDYFPIMEMICTYIRQNAPRVDRAAVANTQNSSIGGIDRRLPRADIQKAIAILGRRSYSSKIEVKFGYEPRLQGTDLEGTDLEGLDLSSAWLGSANLRSSYLGRTNLTGAWLVGADFSAALLSDPFLKKKRVELNGAALRSANFENAINLDQQMLDNACGVKSGYGETKLPKDRDDIHPPDHWFEAPKVEEDSQKLRDAYNNRKNVPQRSYLSSGRRGAHAEYMSRSTI